MQTTITINDQLFEEAAKLVAVENPDLLVEMALTEFIENHQSNNKPLGLSAAIQKWRTQSQIENNTEELTDEMIASWRSKESGRDFSWLD